MLSELSCCLHAYTFCTHDTSSTVVTVCMLLLCLLRAPDGLLSLALHSTLQASMLMLTECDMLQVLCAHHQQTLAGSLLQLVESVKLYDNGLDVQWYCTLQPHLRPQKHGHEL